MSDKEKTKDEKLKQSKIMKFINSNLMKGTERRLTIVENQELSQQNIKKLQNAYKHPFEKIPDGYFSAGY